MPYGINVGTLCVANVVTLPRRIEGNETFVVLRGKGEAREQKSEYRDVFEDINFDRNAYCHAPSQSRAPFRMATQIARALSYLNQTRTSFSLNRASLSLFGASRGGVYATLRRRKLRNPGGNGDNNAEAAVFLSGDRRDGDGPRRSTALERLGGAHVGERLQAQLEHLAFLPANSALA